MFASMPISHMARHSVRPQFVNSSSNTASASTFVNLSLALPTRAKAGHMLFALVGSHDTDLVSAPAGWSVFYENDFFFREGSNRSVGFYGKVATDSEPSSYVFGMSADVLFGNAYAAGVIASYRMVARKPPATKSRTSILNSTTHSFNSFPAVRDQFPILLTGWLGMRSSPQGFTPSSSMTGLDFAGIGGGSQYTQVIMYEQELSGPSDPLLGGSVSVTYNTSIDADTYAAVLEGSYA